MQNKFEQLIELFIAENESAARDLFHEIVVEKSRSIYESLVDEDQVGEEASEEEAIEESEFDETLGGDAADDMINDIESDEEGLSVAEGDDDEEEIEDRVVDIEDALAELQAEFAALMSGESDEEADDMEMDMDSEEEMEAPEDDAEESEEEMESFVREYTERAPAPVTAEQGNGAAGPVAKKNDMGGKAVDPTGVASPVSTPKSTTQTMAANPKGATLSKV